jgi:hypothetical protein
MGRGLSPAIPYYFHITLYSLNGVEEVMSSKVGNPL